MSCGQVPRHRSRACLRLQQILCTASARPLRFHLPPSFPLSLSPSPSLSRSLPPSLPLSLPVYSPPLSPYLLLTFLSVSSPFSSLSLSHPSPSYPLSYRNIRHFSPPRIYTLMFTRSPGQNAFVGLGFEDRGDAFDFNVSLQDHFKSVLWGKNLSQLQYSYIYVHVI